MKSIMDEIHCRSPKHFYMCVMNNTNMVGMLMCEGQTVLVPVTVGS
jgi:hypothetical protein